MARSCTNSVDSASNNKSSIDQTTLKRLIAYAEKASFHHLASTMQAVDNCLVPVILLLARLAKASANPSSVLLHALLQNKLAHAGPDRLLFSFPPTFPFILACHGTSSKLSTTR